MIGVGSASIETRTLTARDHRLPFESLEGQCRCFVKLIRRRTWAGMLLTRAIAFPLHEKALAAQSIRTSGELVRLVIDKRAGARPPRTRARGWHWLWRRTRAMCVTARAGGWAASETENLRNQSSRSGR
jgi:hypothetical protein